MEHRYIEEFDLIDRYLIGKLSGEEEATFEEHFLDCGRCLKQLKVTGTFIDGLRSIAAEGASLSAGAGAGVSAPRAGFFSDRRILLPAAVLLVASLGGAALLARQVGLLRDELRRAKGESARWERRYQDQNESLAESRHALEEAEERLARQDRELEAKGKSADAPSASEILKPAGWLRPRVNVPVVVLSPVARAGSEEAPPEARLPRGSDDFVITLPLYGEPHYTDYLVTVLGKKNRALWKARGLKADSHNSLSIGFNSGFFNPGLYLIMVEGLAAEGASERVATYPLRVSKSR